MPLFPETVTPLPELDCLSVEGIDRNAGVGTLPPVVILKLIDLGVT
jgi:hypothetical protein